MKGRDNVPLISKQQNTDQLLEIYEPYREKLGEERFRAMVNEIAEVSWDALVKLDNYPWNGGLDGHVAEKRQIEKERTLKVLLIKQKYGI